MMKFSERYGYVNVRTTLQVESIDDKLKNALWNLIYHTITEHWDNYDFRYGKNQEETLRTYLCLILWRNYWEYLIDEIPTQNSKYGLAINTEEIILHAKKKFFEGEWFEVLDFIQELARLSILFKYPFIKGCNKILNKHLSAYCLVDETIVPITSEIEIKEIEQALIFTDKYETVAKHLSESLNLLSKNDSSDYRNSFKESISATESMIKITMDDSKSTLGKLLKDFANKYEIHPALAEAYKLLYGFTNDAGGVRHSLKEGDVTIDRDFAKFMLVSCSAFINYLKSLDI